MSSDHVAECLSLCNDVLCRARLPQRVKSLHDVVACCSTTFFLVDAIHAILGKSMPSEAGATPAADTAAIAASIDQAVKQLARSLEVNLSYISGSRICGGSMADTLDLLELLQALGQQQDQQHQQQHQQQQQQQQVKTSSAKVDMSMPPLQNPPAPTPQHQQQVLQLPPAPAPQYQQLFQPTHGMAASAQAGQMSDQMLIYARLFVDQKQQQPALVLASDNVMAAAAAAAAAVAALHGQHQPSSAHGTAAGPEPAAAAAPAAAATLSIAAGGRAAADANSHTSLLASLTDIIPMPEISWEEAVGLVPFGQMPSHRLRKKSSNNGSVAVGGAAVNPPTHRPRVEALQDSPSDASSQHSASSTSGSASSLSFQELQQHERHDGQQPCAATCPGARHQGSVRQNSQEQQQQQQQQQHPQPPHPEPQANELPFCLDQEMRAHQQEQQEQQCHHHNHRGYYHQHKDLPQDPLLDRSASLPPEPQAPSAPPMPPTMPYTISNTAAGPRPHPPHHIPSYLPEQHSHEAWSHWPSCMPSESQISHTQAQPAEPLPRPPEEGPLAYVRRLLQKVTTADGAAGSAGEDAALQRLAAAALEAAQREIDRGAKGPYAPQAVQALGQQRVPGALQHTAGGGAARGDVSVSRPAARKSKKSTRLHRGRAVKKAELSGRRLEAPGAGSGESGGGGEGVGGTAGVGASSLLPMLEEISQLQSLSWAVETHQQQRQQQQQQHWDAEGGEGAAGLGQLPADHGAARAGRWAAVAAFPREVACGSGGEQEVDSEVPGAAVHPSQGETHHQHLHQRQHQQWGLQPVEAQQCEEGVPRACQAVRPSQGEAHHRCQHQQQQRGLQPVSAPQWEESVPRVEPRHGGWQPVGDAWGTGAAAMHGRHAMQAAAAEHSRQGSAAAASSQAHRSAALEQATQEAQRLSAAAAAMLQKQQQQQHGTRSSLTQFAPQAHAQLGHAAAAPGAWEQPPFHMGASSTFKRHEGGRNPSRTKRPKMVRRCTGGGAAATRAAAVHSALLARPCLLCSRAKAKRHFPGRSAADMSIPTPTPTPTSDHLALNRTLAAKLAYVNTLAHGSSHEAAAQVRLAAVALKEEDRRLRMRARALLRQTAAEGRRDQAKQEGLSILEARAQAHSDRVEQLRLERLEAEFKAAEKARRERAAHRQEMAIRDAFLQALDAEKLKLLSVRREGHNMPLPLLPGYLQRLKVAEEHYLGLVTLIEDIAVQERRHRILAQKDAKAARTLASRNREAYQRQRVADLLARVAREEEAAIARKEGRQGSYGLVDRIRRTIGL